MEQASQYSLSLPIGMTGGIYFTSRTYVKQIPKVDIDYLS